MTYMTNIVLFLSIFAIMLQPFQCSNEQKEDNYKLQVEPAGVYEVALEVSESPGDYDRYNGQTENDVIECKWTTGEDGQIDVEKMEKLSENGNIAEKELCKLKKFSYTAWTKITVKNSSKKIQKTFEMYLSQIIWRNIPKLQMIESRGDVVESIEIGTDNSKARQFYANVKVFPSEVPKEKNSIEFYNVCICSRYFIVFDF